MDQSNSSGGSADVLSPHVRDVPLRVTFSRAKSYVFNMEAAMAITTKYCQKELEDYGGCVVSHPASWQEKCLDLKLKVAQCTSSHPVIRKIRTDCASEFSVFERCLRENQSSAEACQPPLARFLACVETVDLSGMANAAPQPT